MVQEVKKVQAPQMNESISREEALDNPMRWAEKYRLNPRQRLREFKFSRPISYDGKSYDVPLSYQDEIYGCLGNLKNLFLAIQKPRQSRISEFCINASFYLCDKYPGFTLVYIFPDDKSGRRFLIKRIDEPINDSDYLSFMVSSVLSENKYRSRNKGAVDSLDIKKMGLSWLYMLASQSKGASRSPDADMAIFDEYDIHDMEKEESFLSTMDDSDHRAKVYVSTPTEPNFGIELRYKATSMAKWMINCSSCYQDFEMNSEYFFNDGVKVLGYERESDLAERIFVCPHCGEELTPHDKQACGRWVHQQPAMKRYNRIGFNFSNLILPHMTADTAWQDYLDFTVKPGGRKKFFNEKLGEPQTDDEKSARFNREIMLKCQNQSLGWVEQSTGGTLMGVDWGKETHVVIWKYYEGKLRLLNFFVFPHDPKPLADAKKVARLIPQFNPSVMITDYGGGQEQNKYMYERFSSFMFMAINNPRLRDMNPQWDKKTRRVYYELITSYSTYARWYPSGLIELPHLDEKLELFIQHHTNSVLINPNERNVPEGVLVVVGRDMPQTVGHTGPIHILSASIFGWLQCMGLGQKEMHFSDAPKDEESGERIYSMVDRIGQTNQNRYNRKANDSSGVTIWRP